MYNIFLYFLLIGYFIIAGICLYTVINIVGNKEKYKTNLSAFLLILTLFNTGVIYSGLYVFSIIFYYSELINTLMWKASLISGFVSLAITSIIYGFLMEYKKIPIVTSIVYITLFGFLIGTLMAEDSILIAYTSPEPSAHFILDPSTYNYLYQWFTGIIVSILQISVVLYYLYVSILIYRNARDTEIVNIFIINTIIFTLPIIMYVLYVFIPIAIFRELHIIFLWIDVIGVCYMVIKKSDLFIVLTNKIYYLHIYHKSGVLLCSYKFKTETDEDKNDSAIWGNILIGINHILSEFVDKSDQIDVIQTKTSDIVVNYNNQCGFAVLVITNKKNEILGNILRDFTNEFMKKYNSELADIQDLNRMISVSNFGDARELIEKSFSMYL